MPGWDGQGPSRPNENRAGGHKHIQQSEATASTKFPTLLTFDRLVRSVFANHQGLHHAHLEGAHHVVEIEANLVVGGGEGVMFCKKWVTH